MSKNKHEYYCNLCGAKYPKWVGKCSYCGEWECVTEIIATESSSMWVTSSKIETLDQVKIDQDEERWASGVHEFDQVLGGGIVKNSVGLLGGTPGIGKSTLILQLLARIVKINKTVLYISGEESVTQIKQRSDRLLIEQTGINIIIESCLETLKEHFEKLNPDFIVIDSIQTLYSNQFTASAGSITQVRETASMLLQYAKKGGCTVMLIGHVTKDGNLAGPKTLEHMVDYVIYLDGEANEQKRILRAVKNRFGPIDEIGLFKMTDKGLAEVSNPNSFFLMHHANHSLLGTSIFSIMEGTRCLLIEVQALVGDTIQHYPARTTMGIERNRLQVIIAVIEKHLKIDFSQRDIYLNIAGGYRTNEPGIDLSIIAALISSFFNFALPAKTLYLGEVALTGEFRSVSQLQARLKEAEHCGFEYALIPATLSQEKWIKKINMQIITINHLQELYNYLK